MQKLKVFFKAHWLAIVGVVIALLVYRSLNSKIAANAQASQASQSAPTGSQMTPIVYPNMSAGGYDSVNGVTAGVSTGNTDAVTNGMLDIMKLVQSGAVTNNAAAIAGSNANTQQATALNSSVTSQLGSAFSAMLNSWSSDPNNQTSTLNVNANPTASGGLSLTAQKDFNASSMPTISQSSNYASNVVSLFTKAATPKVNDVSFANFNPGAYAQAHPDLYYSQKWNAGETDSGRAQGLYKMWQQVSKSDPTQFTPLKTG